MRALRRTADELARMLEGTPLRPIIGVAVPGGPASGIGGKSYAQSRRSSGVASPRGATMAITARYLI
jgi:hypothetical protein